MELGANPKRGLVFTMASKDDGTRQPVPTIIRDIPGGPVVKNLPSDTGDVGSIPSWGPKIPQAAGI